MSPRRNEFLPGTLELLILRTLAAAPMHGYGITQHIQRLSQDILKVEEGSLYPALQRLEVKGWIKSAWRQTPTNRRARYYDLTARGRKQSSIELASFDRLLVGIRRVIKTQEA